MRLYQTAMWHPKPPAQPVPIVEMSKEWRYNAARFMEQRARTIGDGALWNMLLGPQPSGDMACDAFEDELDELEQRLHSDPVGWIRSTPLYQALVAGLPTNPYKLWRLAQRARHFSGCEAAAHNRGPCSCGALARQRGAL